MYIFMFTVFVISMALLVMYRKEKKVLRRMMARGRCGLPGLPNPAFYTEFQDNAEDNVCSDTKLVTKDPFDSQLLTLAKILVQKRKQILDSKFRVDNAEAVIKNLHVSSVGIRRRYQCIMDDLKDELASAEEECKGLNQTIGKANVLKSKFFSDNDDDCDENALPPNKTGGSCCQDQNSAKSGSLGGGPCNISGGRPPKRVSYDCHPPVNSPRTYTTCKCPNPTNPLSTCLKPLPNCNKKSNPIPIPVNNLPQSGAPPSAPIPSFIPPKPPQNCGSCSSGVAITNPPPTPIPASAPIPPPLPCLMPQSVPSASNMSQCSSVQSSDKGKGGCCQPIPKRPTCPDSRCPKASSTCSQSSPEPSESGCEIPRFVKRPPFSTFLGERLPSVPLQRRSIKQTKQTIFTECIESPGEDENWMEPTIVTEVRTSSVTFPPNCCISAYEEFLSGNVKPPPPINPASLPIIIDECDPCSQAPRQISPFEDIENVTHTCGTQTLEEEEAERELAEAIKRSLMCRIP